MDNVQRVIHLRREIDDYRDTISNSYSDRKIAQAIELLEIKTEELDSLEESLTDDELVSLDYHYKFEAQEVEE